MTDSKVYSIENKFKGPYGVICIESKASGLKYIFDGDRRGIIISGQAGMTGLSLRQAQALAEEFSALVVEYLGMAT